MGRGGGLCMTLYFAVGVFPRETPRHILYSKAGKLADSTETKGLNSN